MQAGALARMVIVDDENSLFNSVVMLHIVLLTEQLFTGLFCFVRILGI